MKLGKVSYIVLIKNGNMLGKVSYKKIYLLPYTLYFLLIHKNTDKPQKRDYNVTLVLKTKGEKHDKDSSKN